MRTFINPLLIAFIALYTCNISAQASISDCAKLFDNDFRTYYSSYQRSEAKQYFYELFQQTRRERRRMVRSRSFGFNLSAVVDLVPIQFGGQSSSQKGTDLWHSIATTSLKEQYISDENLNILIQSVYPNRPFDSYDSCLRAVVTVIKDKEGVQLLAIPAGEDKLILKLTWRSTPSGQSIKIDNSTYTGVDIVGAKQIFPSRTIKDGQTLFETLHTKKGETITVTINFNNPGVEGVFWTREIEKEEILGNGFVPIGTIIATILDYQTFLDVNNIQQRNFDIEKSKWAPCDGRSVTKSKYGSKQDKVPDLRGLFIRGANTMSVAGANPIIDSHKNPDNTEAGAFQNHQLAVHSHRYTFSNGHGSPEHTDYSPNEFGFKNQSKETEKYGGNETRPKNMTVYYYIRIN